MHIIIGTLIAIATLVYWLGRASQGAREISTTVNDLKNMPRRRGFYKKASTQGLDLVEDPVDAATVLMIAVARLDRDGRVSDSQNLVITDHLVDHMALPRDAAEEKVFHLRWLSRPLIQPESTLFPMTRLLQKSINKSEARELANMLMKVANTDGDITTAQRDFMRKFQETQGLLG